MGFGGGNSISNKTSPLSSHLYVRYGCYEIVYFRIQNSVDPDNPVFALMLLHALTAPLTGNVPCCLASKCGRIPSCPGQVGVNWDVIIVVYLQTIVQKECTMHIMSLFYILSLFYPPPWAYPLKGGYMYINSMPVRVCVCICLI